MWPTGKGFDRIRSVYNPPAFDQTIQAAYEAESVALQADPAEL